jgi:hypothetical protein
MEIMKFGIFMGGQCDAEMSGSRIKGARMPNPWGGGWRRRSYQLSKETFRGNIVFLMD